MDKLNLIAQLTLDIEKMNIYELRNMTTYANDILENGKIVKARKRREARERQLQDNPYCGTCDCCIELWKNCSCWCSNCNVEYKLCRASCDNA